MRGVMSGPMWGVTMAGVMSVLEVMLVVLPEEGEEEVMLDPKVVCQNLCE